MRERLGREAMWIFFIAHPGQIDELCCGHSPLSVYNVAFALHCPDPATPKGNWFLPLHCPFVSLSSLIVFLFLLIPSSLSHLLSSSHVSLCIFFCTHIRTIVFMNAPCLHLSSFFISFALLPPSLPLALLSWLLLLLLYTVSRSPQLVFALRFIRDLLPVSTLLAVAPRS